MNKLNILILILLINSSVRADGIFDYCFEHQTSRINACVEEQTEYKQQFLGASYLCKQLTGRSESEIVKMCSESLVNSNFKTGYLCLIEKCTK